MIKSLAHICLFSRDLEQTRAFYCDALGLQVKFRFLKDGSLFGFYLRISDSQFIEVFRRDEAASGTPHIGHLCLETDDLFALREKLTGNGIATTEPKKGADNSWQMWVSDPDGTAIEFHQYTPESCQYTGADCIVNW